MNEMRNICSTHVGS